MGTLDHQISSASTNPEAFSDNLIELKKELKVLRRERDHYKEIIKKNKLL
ncbi:MAG: hypothetical protein ACXAES_19410 [Promethearchaeota archaeon]